ncbi:hypothetical protein [Leekyejoonella antrihumi]|uniref:Uncharacterized protein n=1 Tax=Leekyejoonella antrihumi TaxID=1660198 RepID=A0A563DYP7_9MICO|nr:hypothetical protein [Leekyejoonella antrihumi]TWP35315.1 hypothetical protein FGL98_14470 [Leekyejoonella antrihumi]
MKTTDMTRGDMRCIQISMPTLSPVGGGFQGIAVPTLGVLQTSMRDRAFAARDAVHAGVIDYPSINKFADGVSRSAPDRPPA